MGGSRAHRRTHLGSRADGNRLLRGGAACLPLLFWMGKGGSPGPMGIGVAQNNHPRRRQEKEEDSIVFGSPGFSSSISRCWRRLGEGALQARTPGGDSGG